MANKKKNKIIRYPRRRHFNIGAFVFILILIYMSAYVYTYLTRDKIQFYEVAEGGIVNDQRHTGIILRDEVPFNTTTAGNINYYIREGKKAAVGSRIYTIDETGTISQLIAERSENISSISNENIQNLKKEMSSFSQTFDDDEFGDVYDIKYSLDSQVIEFVSEDALKNLEDIIDDTGAGFQQIRSDRSGILSYTIDGMETLTPEQITMEHFDRSLYHKTSVKSGQMVGQNEPAYKMITSYHWSIVFPLTEEEGKMFSGKNSLPIRFMGKNLRTRVPFSMFVGADQNSYGRLDLDKYMEQFLPDRFVDFEIVTDDVRGLKIPKSSVLTKDFFVIPKDFIVKNSDGSARGFHKEVFSEDGPAVEVIPASICYSDEENYYVSMADPEELKAGDYLVKENSEDRFQVGVTAPLTGVYNINKGYSVFKRIEILASNDEYYTIEKGTEYGLSIYDHIVLDASAIKEEGTVIYQ